ncbi:hypothetical protein K490DRAFT_75559 [Saccharata proteae CBS 121410]|uniref:Mis12-domain-containing protein n=1 Tax=Saccharata proteae CBS 121410 TaxID=1314787 RepID=A0A9P4LWB2_9PEZI|nr:hypothetical protein K490DRAFT_75559 [Saccharata proteae CBS 121410]
MASSKQAETALLTEHFRYTPLTLIDQIINMINELINRAIDGLEQGLLGTAPAELGYAAKAAAENTIPDTDGEGNLLFPEARQEIEEGVYKLETLLEATVDKNFDKLEIYVLRNILTVPPDLVPWVRLAHYQDLILPDTKSTPSVTPESIQILRRKVQETQKLNTALLAEKARNDALLTQLRSLVSAPPDMKTERANSAGDNNTTAGASNTPNTLSFLTSTASAKSLGVAFPTTTTTASAASTNGNRHGPLRTNTAFTLSQLPALRTLLESLRPKIATLPVPQSGALDWSKDAARERREYVEVQTRRLLERRGGAGRRAGPEEVRAMEGIAGVLGGRDGGSGDGEGDAMEE